MSPPPTQTPKTLYLAYGSNLSLHQMHLRCPHPPYTGIGRLRNYRWQINTRGYANVVACPPQAQNADTNPNQEVYGLLYTLTPADEARLDKNEGVPHAYTKEDLTCTVYASDDSGGKVDVDRDASEEREVLVYVDRVRVEDGEPRAEYIVRMRRGVVDARARGVPEKYLKDVIGRWISEEEEEGEEEVVELADKQARGFVDESGLF